MAKLISGKTNRFIRLALLTAITAVLGLGSPLSATPTAPVSIVVSPTQGFEPFSTNVRATVLPYEENRELCLLWDSLNGEAGATCRPLEGTSSAKTHYFTLKQLSAGEYIIQAIVIRTNGESRSTQMQVIVLSNR
jgi:hypothetical protein